MTEHLTKEQFLTKVFNYEKNKDFFARVKIATPKYIERLTHRD